MRIEKCWYCSSNIYPGHGVMFVRNDGKVFRFCRSKCHRHFKRKHNPRKAAWTKAYRAAHGKEMTTDSTFDFEKKRNTPVKYDRDLWVKTVRAMKIVDRIRTVRKDRFQKNRLAAQRKVRIHLAEKEIAKQGELLKKPITKLDQMKRREELRRKEGALPAQQEKVQRMDVDQGSDSD
ncbi:hypothetical protein FOL47_003556 [Perkinsus chesapeaki]|uniref:TRASH domain-containing protein n=1 Tax=Perkinsus chesapeaki TaxID=330153 RepID=A0A6V1MLD7_PERCH|nr:hypothetical protein FOL47_003556 [Perkinsus chesapeaki]